VEAVRITKRFKQYIDNHLGDIAEIHSVFDGAINFIDSRGELIGVLSCDKDISPMSMIANKYSFDLDKVIQGNLIQFSKDSINFLDSPLYISMRYPEIVDLELEKMGEFNWFLLQKKLGLMKKTLIEEGSMDGIGELIKYYKFQEAVTCTMGYNDEVNEYCDFINERLVELLNGILDQDEERVRDILPRIIGFGPGLTPSTDDFMVGILMILKVTNHENKEFMISDWQGLYEGKTTKISENMIKNAVKGYVAESYKELNDVLYNDDILDIEAYVKRVIQKGSSSGSDFILGVYCMLNILYMRWKRRRYSEECCRDVGF
jgi:hypothetical protein